MALLSNWTSIHENVKSYVIIILLLESLVLTIKKIKFHKLFKKIVFIQLSLLIFSISIDVFFDLNGAIIYLAWSIYVCYAFFKLLIHLPWNMQSLMLLLLTLPFIMLIGALIDSVISHCTNDIFSLNTKPSQDNNIHSTNNNKLDGG